MRTKRDLPCSFERLIQQAVACGVVKTYHESPTAVRLEMCRSVVELDPFHGRMLLCNRLRAEGVAVASEAPSAGRTSVDEAPLPRTAAETSRLRVRAGTARLNLR